jgi:hypothetical protein
MKSRLVLVSLVALAAIALLTSACGGKSAAPGIANLGTTGATTTNATTTPVSGSGSSSSSSGGGAQLNMRVQNGAQFASCMRKNGVPNFPDPSSSGNIGIGPSSGINPDSPNFKAAQQKCRKLLPNGGQPSPAQIAKAQQAALNFSKCMRAHGVKDFPDPTFGNGGGIGIKIGSRAGGLNPNNPTFKAAQKACQGQLPFGKGGPGGGTTSSGGGK